MVNSVCVYFSSIKDTWCNAQDFCRKIGGELMTGDTFLQAHKDKFFNKSTSRVPEWLFWLGATDMSDERNSSRKGWKWTNGSQISDTSINWSNDQPGNRPNEDQDCLQIDRIWLLDIDCTNKFFFICQQKSFTVLNDQIFVLTDIFVSNVSEKYAKGACTSNLIAVSEIDCAFKCLQEVTCVSIYFLDEKSECIIIRYTDVRLNVSNGHGWKKFVIQSLVEVNQAKKETSTVSKVYQAQKTASTETSSLLTAKKKSV